MRAERPRGPGLREVLARLVERRLGLVELAPHARWSCAREREARGREPPTLPLSSASSSARSTSGCRLVELEAREVDAGELRRRPALSRSLRPACARELERLCSSPLAPRRGRRASRRSWRLQPERVEAARRSSGSRTLERLLDHRSARVEVAVAQHRNLRERATAPGPAIRASPASAAASQHFLHLARDRRQVAQAPGRARGEVAALEGRLELDRAERTAGAPTRFASRASARRPASSSAAAASRASSAGAAAVELCEQRGRVVEVVGADLEQLLAGPLLQPLGEARVVLGARRPSRARSTRPRGSARA